MKRELLQRGLDDVERQWLLGYALLLTAGLLIGATLVALWAV